MQTREEVLAAVRTDGWVLRLASMELRADREVVLEAVKNCGGALQFAAAELCGDRDVVLEAVKQCGTALVFAYRAFRSDREIVLEALKTTGRALLWASAELQNDEELIFIAVRKTPRVIEHLRFMWSAGASDLIAAAQSAIAKEHDPYPVLLIDRVTPRPNGSFMKIEVLARTMAGNEHSVVVSEHANMGTLAKAFVEKLGGQGYVHMVFPDRGLVTPFEWRLLLCDAV